MTGAIAHIIVIESLEGERLTGTELYKDCIVRNIEYRKSPISPRFFAARTKAELADALQYCVVNAPYMPSGILVHLEAHGAADRTGLVLADGALIVWEELVDLMRQINVACCNNLYISLAACEGRYLYLGAKLGKKSPYASFISASIPVYPEQIVNEFTWLFEHLIENGNLIDSTLYMQDRGSAFYYKDSKTTFEEAFAVTAERMRHDPALREDLIQQTRVETARQGVGMPPETSFEWMVELALRNAYAREKKTFEFSDC
jgi:hypothetical protein